MAALSEATPSLPAGSEAGPVLKRIRNVTRGDCEGSATVSTAAGMGAAEIKRTAKAHLWRLGTGIETSPDAADTSVCATLWQKILRPLIARLLKWIWLPASEPASQSCGFAA